MSVYRNYTEHIFLLVILLSLIGALSFGLELTLAESFFNRVEGTALGSDTYPSCRIGATLGSSLHEALQVDWLDDLGAGWYATFDSDPGGMPSNGAEFVPLIWVQQRVENGVYMPTFHIRPGLNDQGLGRLIDARPGALWIVGNEVDRGPQPGMLAQAGTFPDIYAQAYHQIYHYIKERDSTALVANSGLVEVTPGRLQYLDLMWESYLDRYHEPMPVDVWNMHIYVLPEVDPYGQPNGIASVAVGTDPELGKMESFDPDGSGPRKPLDTCPLEDIYCIAEHDDALVFAQQVLAMRNWMAEHGQRNKPLILSEFSLIYPYLIDPDGACWLQDENGNCFTNDRTLSYMDATLDYLTSARDGSLGYPLDNNRLVQQWLWFSIANSPGVGGISDLVTLDLASNRITGLTAIGERFRSWAQAEPTEVNLLPRGYSSSITFSGESGETAEATLKIAVGNNGNMEVLAPYSVTFYADASLKEVIGSVDPGMTVPGCARRTIDAQVNWSDLSPGVHRYWVKIDSDSQIIESNENDNVSNGIVFVDPQQVFLPIVLR
jgi:hypothetical protein